MVVCFCLFQWKRHHSSPALAISCLLYVINKYVPCGIILKMKWLATLSSAQPRAIDIRKRVLDEFSGPERVEREKGYLLLLWWKLVVKVSHFCPKVIMVSQCSVEAPCFPPPRSILKEADPTSSPRDSMCDPNPSQREPHTPQAWLGICSSTLRTNGVPEALGVISGHRQVYFWAAAGAFARCIWHWEE